MGLNFFSKWEREKIIKSHLLSFRFTSTVLFCVQILKGPETDFLWIPYKFSIIKCTQYSPLNCECVEFGQDKQLWMEEHAGRIYEKLLQFHQVELILILNFGVLDSDNFEIGCCSKFAHRKRVLASFQTQTQNPSFCSVPCGLSKLSSVFLKKGKADSFPSPK